MCKCENMTRYMYVHIHTYITCVATCATWLQHVLVNFLITFEFKFICFFIPRMATHY